MADNKRSTARQRRKRQDILASAPVVESWPIPRSEDIPPSDQASYYARKLAVEMWTRGSTEAEIATATNLDAAEARRIAQRCITLNRKTRAIHGFWACLPNRHLERVAYTRSKPFDESLSENGKGMTGALNDLFKRYPRIVKGMREFATTRRVGQGAPVAIISRATLHQAFIALCKEEHLDQRKEWPFNTVRRGYKAIWEWYKKFTKSNPINAARSLLGDEAAKLTTGDYAGIASSPVDGLRLAYERVELDEHKLDGIFTVVVPIGNGRFVSFKTTRLWALILREVTSRAVLASGISFGLKYSTSDVLALVYRALCPPQRKTLTFSNPHYQYRSDAAYPAELPEFRGNGWQTLALDADSTHLSVQSLDAAREIVKCDVLSERIGDPSARGCVEGFFPFLSKLMESSPAATGSKPDDKIRRDPEGAAIRWNIVGTLAEEILDLYCRNFNATASETTGGVSPLAKLSELVAIGECFRFPINDLSTPALWKLLPRVSARVSRRRGNNGFGPLGVNLFGGRYVGPQLSRDHELAFTTNKDVTVYVQEDARFAFIVPTAFPDRVYPVTLKGRYSDIPHTLAWRRLASNAAKNAAIIAKADSPQIMFGLLQGLGEVAKNNAEATALLSGAVSFMNRYGNGEVGYVEMQAEQRAALVEYARTQMEEDENEARTQEWSDDLQSSPSAANPPTPTNDPFGLL